jgi:hypothetical protein
MLESRIREEIDSWDISIEKANGNQVQYLDLVKPLLYGMGIGVTEKIRDELETTKTSHKNYWDMDYQSALEEFRKDYIIWHLAQNDFSAKRTAVAIELANSAEVGRTSLAHILQCYNITATDVKKEPEKYLGQLTQSTFEQDNDTLVAHAKKEISRYASCINPILLKRLISRNSLYMAERFVEIAKQTVTGEVPESMPLFAFNYQDALEKFTVVYLKEQFYRSGMKTSLAAKRAGLSDDSSFRHMLLKRRIRISDLKKERRTD